MSRRSGFGLCIPAGTAARFEPGEEKRVTLVALAGNRVVHGINGLTNGALDDAQIRPRRLRARPSRVSPERRRPVKIPRKQYADLFGPTTGDRVRLADTDLIIEIEKDLTCYGDEVVFGGGKVLRDGMGQSARATKADGALDTVITNALILDYWGIIKADIGIKDGRIVGIGKAGNPDTMPNVSPGMACRRRHRSHVGEKAASSRPAALRRHIHFICPQQC